MGRISLYSLYETATSAPMKIPVDDIPLSPKEISFTERTEGLNEFYTKESAADFHFPSELAVTLSYYRSGEELFFHGEVAGRIAGRCGRCLEEYEFELQRPFALVLVPAPDKTGRGAEELRGEELGLSYYSTEEINLAPLIVEQVVLAMPTRPLCKDSCRGLCDRCGVNLNSEECHCSDATGDPRMAIFRTLKVGR